MTMIMNKFLLTRKRQGSQPYSQFDNLNLRFMRGGSGRSSTGSRRSDFMVTEAGAGGGEGGHGAAVEGGHHQTQTSQYSQWTGCSRY